MIWSDGLPQLSIGQPRDQHQKVKRCQTHMACIDQRNILACVQILLDFRAIHFKFYDRINQWPINFQTAISGTAQGDKCFCPSWQSVKLCPNSNKYLRSMQGAYFWSHAQSAYQHVKISQGLRMDVPNHLLYAQHCIQISQGLLIDVPNHLLYFLHVHHREWKTRGSIGMCSIFSIWLTKFSKVFVAQQILSSMVWLDPQPRERLF
jgi:hypothetical protein